MVVDSVKPVTASWIRTLFGQLSVLLETVTGLRGPVEEGS